MDAKLKEIRKAVADYMWSEGCSCCRDSEKHDESKVKLAKLLNVKKKKGFYDFSPFKSAVGK